MQLQTNFSLKDCNSFGIDICARLFAEITSESDFLEIISDKKLSLERKIILGGGSNILFTRNYDGLVIKNNLHGIEWLKEDAHHVWLRVAAGEIWHDLVLHSVERNWSGIENLSLIPGLVGAAPMQNIGAYGAELKETCEQVETMNIRTAEKKNFNNSDCEFGYRESIFKHKLKDQFLITALTLKLNKIFKPNIRYGDIRKTLDDMRADEITVKTVSDAVIKIRSSKLPDPKVIGNAGSFFKNPVVSKQKFESLVSNNPLMPNYPQKHAQVKIPAGWLIEQCGWKGKRIGNTGAHQQQALVLVNYGGATGEEIYSLAMQIQKSVKEKFDVGIESEVNVI